ncbi:unnamed protein product [Paramecium pentaurelia]|uniref:Uncharacterized protein n=1 Tax=Paramecium pentaurelia TaxID=43138 RepID=A0A8S1VWU7_9CILI|nr:unnamed protein product [Paramecium pentaurelia]
MTQRQHQKNVEYLSIDQLNGRIIQSIKNIFDKTKQDFQQEVDQMRKKFQEFTDELQIKFETNLNNSYQLQLQSMQLEKNNDEQAYAQLEQNESSQQLIQEEVGIEVQNDFVNDNPKYLLQQSKNDASELFDNNQNLMESNKQTKPRIILKKKNDTHLAQSQDQNQFNQSTKSDIKTQKISDKQNEICQNQENNQTDDQQQIEKQFENLAGGDEQQDRKRQQTPRSKNENPNQIIQQNLRQQEPEDQQQISQEKYEINRIDEEQVFQQPIKKIFVVDKDTVVLASETLVKIINILRKEQKCADTIIQQPILDIGIIESKNIFVQTSHILYIFNFSLGLQKVVNLCLTQNQFAFKNNLLYNYYQLNQRLEERELIQFPKLNIKKQFSLESNNNVVAIKIIGEKIHIGFSKGFVQHYNFFNFKGGQKFELQTTNLTGYGLFYFEQDYFIGVQKDFVIIKFYKNHKDIKFHSKDTIIQCSYLINLEKDQFEIQCLQDNGKVFFYVQSGQQILRESVLRYKNVSSIQVCPQSKIFYYGHENGKLLWGKVKKKSQ